MAGTSDEAATGCWIVVARDGSGNANLSSVEKVQFSTLPSSHAITTAANPPAGGTASCTPNPVDHGGNSSCSYSENAGYTFTGWSGDCSGMSCTISNVTSAKSVMAAFEAVTSYTAPAPTGSGDVTLDVAGSDCVLTSAQFISAPAGMPANMVFLHGLADFTLTDNGVGDSDPANGVIRDPSGVGVAAAAAAGAQAIPVMGLWSLGLLSGLLGLGAWARLRLS